MERDREKDSNPLSCNEPHPILFFFFFAFLASFPLMKRGKVDNGSYQGNTMGNRYCGVTELLLAELMFEWQRRKAKL